MISLLVGFLMIRYELTELEKDALREVGYIGAGHASKALSQMIGESIDVTVPLAQTIPLEEIPKTVGGPEALVTGIYLPITGDVKGSVLLIFPQKSALLLADIIQGKEPGTTKKLDEMDKSALEETGNILAGNCLTALSKFLRIKLVEHIPDITSDMISAVMDYVVVKFGQEAERALVLEVEFNTKGKKIPGYFFLLFNLKEADKILKALRKEIKRLIRGESK